MHELIRLVGGVWADQHLTIISAGLDQNIVLEAGLDQNTTLEAN